MKKSSYEIKEEVEVRGLLRRKEFQELKNRLMKNGRYIGVFNRFLIDYTTPVEGIENRKLDVRVRVTNGEPELIAKVGKWAGQGRKEISVILKENQFVNSIVFLRLLGEFLDCSGYFRKGVACVRKIWRYLYEEVEFSLVEVIKLSGDFKEKRGYSFFFEAEMSVPKREKRGAFRKIVSVIRSLNLRLFYSEEMAKYLNNVGVDPTEILMEEDFYEYIDRLNREANMMFDASNFDAEKIGKLGL